MEQKDLKQRTKEFALRVIRLVESLPKGQTSDVLGRQLLRSGTSVGANYRAACRAKSPADFISKMGTVEEETEMTHSVFRTPHSAIKRLVVIAASAGGIDALTQVLSHLPAGLSTAIIVVQHLRDDKPTHLPEHLDRLSPLRVCLAKNRMPIEPGVVYIAEPGKHLSIDKRYIVLDTSKKLHYVRPSADVLFTSAAQAFGPDVIGVILSGTGKDGAVGFKEIKAKGGATIAQDEKTSTYFGMPKAAIDAGAVDYVLPVEEIGAKIVEIVRNEE